MNAGFEEVRLSLPHIELAAHLYGPEEGLPVLALHGWLDNAATFTRLAPLLVGRIFEVIARLKAEGTTILLVEQNFRFAATIADRHYVMEEGNIVDMIPNDQLEANMGKLHEYLGV
mgnify:CR=1 FL=1